MQWCSEVGFDRFEPCIEVVKQHLVETNARLAPLGKLVDLKIIDPPVNVESYLNQRPLLITSLKFVDLPNQVPVVCFGPAWFGVYSGAVPVKLHQPTRDFNCFMSRMDPTRQSWLYQLVRRGYLDRGYVSFLTEINRYHLTDPEVSKDATQLEIFDHQFRKYYSNFGPEHQHIRSRVPFRNFDADVPLQDIVLDSKFSVVIETHFCNNNVITYSEKIFRCLKLPRPWLLFTVKNGVQYLRDLGFDVLDDIVDHAYDRLDFEIDRQVAILDQIAQLSKLEFIPALHNRLNRAAQQNQQLLDKFYREFNSCIQQKFDQAESLAKTLCENK